LVQPLQVWLCRDARMNHDCLLNPKFPTSDISNRHKRGSGVGWAAMSSGTANLRAGEQLKALRSKMRLTTRDVEKLSLQICESRRNREYYICHAWVTDLENGRFTPSIYKLYSLSAIYHSRFSEVAGYFGLGLKDIGLDQIALRLPRTHLLSGHVAQAQGELNVPVQLAAAYDFNETRTLSRASKEWLKVPLLALQNFAPQEKLYGYVGQQDFTLYPIIRPGSFVEIDSRQKNVSRIPWTSEQNRPIFFVELPNSCVCAWCQLDCHKLSIVPHPISGQRIRRLKYPDEAKIVGRVTAVTMQLVDLDDDQATAVLGTNSP
jgi:hypothetical protein